VRPQIEEPDFRPARCFQFKDDPRQGPGLCISRSLGDCGANACGVIPNPEVVEHNITPEDEYLIIASDGVWEFVENDEAIRWVHKLRTLGKSAKEATRALIAKASVYWLRAEEGAYRDDITAIVVYLQPVKEQLSTCADS